MTVFDVEYWRDIPGYEDCYQASSLGNIRVKDRIIEKRYSNGRVVLQSYKGKIMRARKHNKYGHKFLLLSKGGIVQGFFVHTLVLMTFVGPRPVGMEARHLDGDATNNAISNLEWNTHLVNMRDRLTHGTYAKGEEHSQAKLTADQVALIYSSDKPHTFFAKQFGVTSTAICSIRRGRSWASVTGANKRA